MNKFPEIHKLHTKKILLKYFQFFFTNYLERETYSFVFLISVLLTFLAYILLFYIPSKQLHREVLGWDFQNIHFGHSRFQSAFHLYPKSYMQL